MAKEAYIEVDNIARKVKNVYMSIFKFLEKLKEERVENRKEDNQ